MIRLALRSFAHHRTTTIATGLVALVGTLLVTAMASLLGTGLAGTTVPADRPFLVQFPLILGGWVVAIVVFAMVSTIGVALEGRSGEIAGLRLIGATPRQVQQLIAVETLAVSVLAALPGLGGGYLLGWILSASVHAAGLTDAASVYSPGVLVPLAGALVVIAAGIAAAWIGSRPLALRSPVGEAVPVPRNRAARVATARRRGRAAEDAAAALRSGPGVALRWRPDLGRRIVAAIAIAAGLGSSAAVLGIEPDNVLSTALTGPGCVLVAVGACLLAPELIGLVNVAVRLVLPARRDAATHLAAINLAAAPGRVRPAVTFLTLFMGVAAGTLSMQGIENSVGVPGSTASVLASINYLVVGLIAAFMAIALTNNLVASISHRRSELAVMSLIGSTGSQTLGMLVREAVAAVVVSVLAGGVGAFLAVAPFALRKTGNPLDAAAPLPYLLTMLIGAAVTIGVTVVVGRRATATA